MYKIYVLILIVSFPFITLSQYCTFVGPSSNADSNVQSVNLTGDNGSISFVGCPGVIGLQDLSTLSTVLSGGSNYSASIQFGTCGGSYTGKGEAWIDFNGDQLFSIDESIGTWQGIPPRNLSIFNFTVPSGVTNGLTRMRITQQEGDGITFPLDPCATFTWGSVMDFSIVLTGGMDCSGFIGNTIEDPIVTSVYPYTDIHSTAVCYSNNDYVYASPDVYYLILPADNSSSLHVSLCGSSFDTFLSVFDTDGNSIAFNDDGNCGSQSELSFSTVELDSAYVIVQGWGTENGDYELNVTESVLDIVDYSQTLVEVYPNPVINQFSIRNLYNRKMIISDVSGKTCIEFNKYTGELISTDNFEEGIYFVSYIDNDEVRTMKLIVSK